MPVELEDTCGVVVTGVVLTDPLEGYVAAAPFETDRAVPDAVTAGADALTNVAVRAGAAAG